MGSHTVARNMSCPCTEMSAWWWLIVTETCRTLHYWIYCCVLTERYFSFYVFYRLWIGHDREVILCTRNKYRILVRQHFRSRQFVQLIRRNCNIEGFFRDVRLGFVKLSPVRVCKRNLVVRVLSVGILLP